jgi:1-deoxy-D-xylulose-5-phosphate synthase
MTEIYKYLDKISKPSDIKNLQKTSLTELSQEIRNYIIKIVSKNGGHLASSLGVVDLTVALFYVFDFERDKDKLIWDVGHQAYTHKILTGRFSSFPTLRQYKGISGFPKIDENPYDVFGTGHSSTSISAGLGFAVARDLNKADNNIISIIGDGSMTGGQAFEGLNNAGHLGKDMLVILNDNEMFISERVGALGKYFTKILSGGFVKNAEKKVDYLVKKFKLPKNIIDTLLKRIKTILTPGMLFEELGFSYFGPVDGHDINTLIDVLTKIKKLKGPVLLHVVTKKGKGYQYAEEAPSKFHGLGKFDKETGETTKISTTSAPTYTQIFGKTLLEEASKNDKIIAITAAMCEGTGLLEFEKKYPDRYFDVGIAEPHAITFSAGLAKNGFKPVCAIYSTFLQRAYDQIIHDVCLQNLPVIFAIDRAGIVGEDGATHNGVFDLSYLRIIPNLVIMSPKDETELAQMLRVALTLNKPCAIRYPRGSGYGIKTTENSSILDIGKAEMIFEKGDITVIAIGSTVYPSKFAIEKLQQENINLKLVNLRFLKPIDEDLIRNLAHNSKAIITVEENVLAGGMGSYVREILSDENIKIFSIGLPDEFIEHGPQNKIRDIYNLSEEKLSVIFRQISSNYN